MKHCAEHNSTLAIEHTWALNLATIDMFSIPIVFLWRHLATDTVPSPGLAHYRSLQEQKLLAEKEQEDEEN